MGDLLRVLILAVIVIITTVIVFSIKGEDTFDKSKLAIAQNLGEEEFNYKVAPWEFNGYYQNGSNPNTYILVAKKEEGTVRMYFVKKYGFKMIQLRLDDLELDEEGIASFRDPDSGHAMTATFYGDSKQIRIKNDLGIKDFKNYEGTYSFISSIRNFSLSEMNI